MRRGSLWVWISLRLHHKPDISCWSSAVAHHDKTRLQLHHIGFYGLAFSTLAADAMLHLMPQFLGLHSHGPGEDHGHSHEGGYFEPYAQLMLGVFFTIYGLFLFESIMCAFNKTDHSTASALQNYHNGVISSGMLPRIAEKNKSSNSSQVTETSL
ncbi:zinc transporter ZIP12 [Caerostris extrusa]|uniref:Zinc transporter ZIP12 n=1 Tax=Caerostris extrusa TaxID=172846 RepID=A0AAV4TD91_CAEEX|nr:zinc transporter ZIP12 [Caerostris extrusa]